MARAGTARNQIDISDRRGEGAHDLHSAMSLLLLLNPFPSWRAFFSRCDLHPISQLIDIYFHAKG